MKFPRIPHLPWSESRDEDDLVLENIDRFREETLIYTEKLDGECTFMSRDMIHARSEDSGYQAPWQTYIKRYWGQEIRYLLPDHLGIYGESLFGIHSIEYEELPYYFHVFGMVNLHHQIYLDWDDVCNYCHEFGLHHVPILYHGELQEFPLPDKSSFGTQCEGYVVRRKEHFAMSDFSANIAKYVRQGHVKTDEHWTKNWKKASLINEN